MRLKVSLWLIVHKKGFFQTIYFGVMFSCNLKTYPKLVKKINFDNVVFFLVILFHQYLNNVFLGYD